MLLFLFVVRGKVQLLGWFRVRGLRLQVALRERLQAWDSEPAGLGTGVGANYSRSVACAWFQCCWP